MADQIRQCMECGNYSHISTFNVGWRGCWECEQKRRNVLHDLGILTPDQMYAQNEEKVWKFAKNRGLKVDRLN